MAIRQYDAVQHYQENLQQAELLSQHWLQLARQLDVERPQIEAELAHARSRLGAAYLLNLLPASMERAERLTGYRGFTRRDPVKAMAHERVVLQNTVKKIEADERWIRRQYLVGPEGEYTRELAEAQSMLEPWQAECARFEDLDGFLELVEIGYDTPNFSENWYEARYWKHWAAGDRICSSLGLSDFGDDVLPAYHEVREPRDKWVAEVARVEAKIDQVHALAQGRDNAEARIPELPEIYLQSCQDQLGVFFETADLGLLEEWLQAEGGDHGVQQVLRRCAGLAAKLEFLNEIAQSVSGKLQELQRRSDKYRRKIAKFQRPKYASSQFPETVLDRGFQAKRDKYFQQPVALHAQVQRVLVYDDYGAFDLSNDPELWWMVMTRKRPSAFSPRLRSWYERHPDAAPELDEDESLSAAVVAAAATFDQTDRGYLS